MSVNSTHIKHQVEYLVDMGNIDHLMGHIKGM